MRIFTPEVQAVIDSGDIRFFFLIELYFSQTYRFTSYKHDITHNNKVYTAGGGLFEFDSPKFSTVVDREAYRIVIADLIDQMPAEFRYNVTGKDIKVMVGLLDANDNPLVNSHILDVYKGYVDSPAINNDWETKLAVIEGTSPMSDLDMVNTFITSKDGMDQRNINDTSFDEIYTDNEVSLKWGKI